MIRKTKLAPWLMAAALTMGVTGCSTDNETTTAEDVSTPSEIRGGGTGDAAGGGTDSSIDMRQNTGTTDAGMTGSTTDGSMPSDQATGGATTNDADVGQGEILPNVNQTQPGTIGGTSDTPNDPAANSATGSNTGVSGTTTGGSAASGSANQ